MATSTKPQLGKADSLTEWMNKYSDWILGVGVLGLIVTLITPLSPTVLDLLLATNITAGVMLLMVTLNAREATELSAFPTILLFTTLFRLGLNVASTRLILTGGEAGEVITAFGQYVGGDDLAVGFVVFLILIIIQFVVITKGSGRISEVAARFVLDAMPGKQMAIDADLSAGMIDADQAKDRREAVASEAEFYGSMDGASKFVRGDAIAGLIITALNLVGGIAIASAGGMTLSEAVSTYSKLTIGDGLVSQIPALFVSVAAGVLVTKERSDSSLGTSLLQQISGRPRATAIAAATMFTLGLMPGMPKLPFFVLASVLLIVWRTTHAAQKDEAENGAARKAAAELEANEEAGGASKEDEQVGGLLKVDRICLEIGYRVIPLVQGKAGNGILDHVAQLRRRFALREGVVLPPIRIKDNIKLAPNAYAFMVGGQEVASGFVEPGHYLAMDPGNAAGAIEGKETKDPAFGLPAWWVGEGMRDEAEVLGYTVIDPTSVLVTHLAETLRSSLAELLTRDDVKELVETAREISPAVVEELVPDKMSIGGVQKVLRNLLRESVSIRNMPAILEVLADCVDQVRDPEAQTELVRQRLGRAICDANSGSEGTVFAVTLDPAVEGRLASAVGLGDGSPAQPASPAWLQALLEHLGNSVGNATRGGKQAVVLVRSNVRRFLAELVRTTLPSVAVLSYNEVVPAKSVETVDVVNVEEN
ncbi:MAG: flagellar biosynthesis protein FlhA [Planctomycetota bacterium]|jgi:flagellar biosynthesis protein FlhA